MEPRSTDVSKQQVVSEWQRQEKATPPDRKLYISLYYIAIICLHDCLPCYCSSGLRPSTAGHNLVTEHKHTAGEYLAKSPRPPKESDSMDLHHSFLLYQCIVSDTVNRPSHHFFLKCRHRNGTPLLGLRQGQLLGQKAELLLQRRPPWRWATLLSWGPPPSTPPSSFHGK